MSALAALVLDDLPNLSANDLLADRLASLAVTWWNTGGHVLSTSQYELPTRLLGILGTQVNRLAAPEMDYEDVEELLASAGATLEFLTPNTVRNIVGSTKGHPVLVGAVAQWLPRNNWRLDDRDFTSLLTGSALAEPMTEARTKVRGLVNSDDIVGGNLESFPFGHSQQRFSIVCNPRQGDGPALRQTVCPIT